MRKLFVTFIYTIVVRPWLTFFIGVSFHNVKHLRDADQFIIVANHNSHFDTVSIMAALPSKLRKIHVQLLLVTILGNHRLLLV